MIDQNFNNIYCSRKYQDFVLLYDGQGTYYLFYEDDLLLDIKRDLNPKQLHKEYNTKLFALYSKIKENPIDDFINTILETIADEIGDNKDNDRRISTIAGDLIRSIKDAYSQGYNGEHFKNAPQKVLDKAMDISTNKGYGAAAFEELMTPKTIEEEIQQRIKPVLTSNEKAKADAIADEINQKGLLNFLKENLDKIHIGSHKNIYRKTLAEFKKMRGESRYIGETNAKSEAGKSFEDEIVYKTIIPPRYVLEINKITEAAFTTYANTNPRYFDRITLLLGDYGSKKSFKKIEGLLDVIKPLITEGYYRYDKLDKENNSLIIQSPLEVDGFGAVYQTTKNSFTEDDDQLISRTLYSTPAKVDPKKIAHQIFYLRNPKTRQSRAKADAEQKLKDFGLYLMQMVNTEIEVINPYEDVFWEYASISETPIREFNQQLDLFDAYCILTKDKCSNDVYDTLFASIEQLKEFMDFINLENALIPYEYDFLNMLLAKGKVKELTILYTDADTDAEDNSEDLDLSLITTLTDCENTAIEDINLKEMKKQKRLYGNEEEDMIQTKADLSPQQLKELPQKLLAKYGFRSQSASQRIFFRVSDLKHYYSKMAAYKNIDNVNQLLQTLYNKGYLGKYEYKHNKENLYYLTPKCNNLKDKTDFKPKKSYNRYVTDYFMNADKTGFLKS